MFRLSSLRHFTPQANIIPHPSNTKRFLSRFTGTLFAVGGVGAFTYMIHKGSKPRETEILHPPINLLKHSQYIVNAENYVHLAPKPKGDLSGDIVVDLKGNQYLKKGAQDLETLVKEFVISNFLAIIKPGIQPESLIMQEDHEGVARFYTLSKIAPKSIDLEEFITRGDWKERLQKKPLVGFEIALAADFMLAKQRDMKFANYIIIETEHTHVVATIDHELAGEDIFSVVNKVRYTTDIDDLCSRILDLHERNEDNNAGLADDPRSQEFMAFAKTFMKEENILEFYQQVCNVRPDEISKPIENIDGEDGLITRLQCHRYLQKIQAMQTRANQFLYERVEETSRHDNELETRPTLTFCGSVKR